MNTCSHPSCEGGWAGGLSLAAYGSPRALGQPHLVRRGAEFSPTDGRWCDNHGLDKIHRETALETEAHTDRHSAVKYFGNSQASTGCILSCENVPYGQFNDY